MTAVHLLGSWATDVLAGVGAWTLAAITVAAMWSLTAVGVRRWGRQGRHHW